MQGKDRREKVHTGKNLILKLDSFIKRIDARQSFSMNREFL